MLFKKIFYTKICNIILIWNLLFSNFKIQCTENKEININSEYLLEKKILWYVSLTNLVLVFWFFVFKKNKMVYESILKY